MTDLADTIRSTALGLPEVEERGDGFYVAGTPFVRATDAGWQLLTATGWAGAGDDAASVEDRVAASWELAAPARLLEAGGR